MKTKYRIHPIFSDLIPAALSACDGILFDNLTSCPHCGGSLARYDVKKKRFAEIIEGSSPKTITVFVKRFRCRVCRAVVYADQPFYQNTRIGSPVVDLCVTFKARMTFGHASTYLQQIGVNVDRWSVRNYAKQIIREIPTTEQFGIVLPVSIISLAALTSNIGIGTSIRASEVLSACGYPSSQKPEDTLGKP
jgi:hypothetical protein